MIVFKFLYTNRNSLFDASFVEIVVLFIFLVSFPCFANSSSCFFSEVNPFTPGTFTRDNPPIPWQFLVENKRTQAPKISHMRSKTRDKLWLSNKLFLFDELMGSQGV